MSAGTSPGRPLPRTDDHDTEGFWQAAARHELAVRRCRSCGHVLHLPRAHCSACGAGDSAWVTVDGAATLHSWTTSAFSVHPGLEAPYTVALVELVEPAGVRFVTLLPGTPELTLDEPMTLWFEDLDDVVLPQWKPVRSGG